MEAVIYPSAMLAESADSRSSRSVMEVVIYPGAIVSDSEDSGASDDVMGFSIHLRALLMGWRIVSESKPHMMEDMLWYWIGCLKVGLEG